VVEAAGVPYVLALASLLALGGAAVMIGVPPHRPEPHAEEVAAGEPTIVPG
jgi:hypothetical protein